uniref:rRNA-processing protein FCF1 homolog n=1 Tax=Strongyloides venezuelensis TaxID=75913 RepID=A0A0K0G0R7_STRVS
MHLNTILHFYKLFYLGKYKSTAKFAKNRVKQIKATDERISEDKRKTNTKKEDDKKIKLIEAPKVSSAMFLRYNTQLGPPFHVIIDTNFINFSVKNKIELMKGLMDCLYAKVIPYVTDCVFGELEKNGNRFKVALKILKDSRVRRLKCTHKGIYADDCIVDRIKQHKCYIVATCDKDLKNRIRKIPGVPIMYIANYRYTIERMPDAFGAKT